MPDEDTKAKPTAWWEEFIKPFNAVGLILAVLGVAVGVFGVALAIYFYRASTPRPEITWDASTQMVFDARTGSGLSILDTNKQPITDDVWALQTSVWNSGTEKFDNVDDTTSIRKPLTIIDLSKSVYKARILSASIIGRLNDTDGAWCLENSDKSVAMHWKHFDQGAGAEILVLFAGSPPAELKPDLKIAGQLDLRPENREVHLSPLLLSLLSAIAGIWAFLTLLFFSLMLSDRLGALFPSEWGRGFVNLVSSANFAAFCAVVIYIAATGFPGISDQFQPGIPSVTSYDPRDSRCPPNTR